MGWFAKAIFWVALAGFVAELVRRMTIPDIYKFVIWGIMALGLLYWIVNYMVPALS